MTKNLITGVNGFVGGHLAKYLLELGEEVFGTYRWNCDTSQIESIRDKMTMITMELNDLSSCLKTIKKTKPDMIFHLAAQSFVSDSYEYPLSTIHTNTIGTGNLLEAIRFVKEDDPSFDPIVHVCSTSEVYGLVNKEELPIKETTRFNPSNPYAVGKVGADMLALLYWTNHKIKTIRTRMFTHTGPGRKMMSAECNFARQIALIEQGKQEPVIKHGNLGSVRTWNDVRDAVKAYHILVRKCMPGDVYNIGGNTTKTIGEMLDHLISLSPMKDQIRKEQDPKLMRPYDVDLQVPDTSKFKEETGWDAEISFEQTMQDLLDWWRDKIKRMD